MRTLLWLSFLTAIMIFGSAIAIEVAALDPAMSDKLQGARELVRSIGVGGWAFIRPLLQLAVVLLILDWLATRLGVRIKKDYLRGNWTVQTFIAGLIITTFCIAILADIQAVTYLKDVVLIVIGFYFGTQAKIEPQDTAATHPGLTHDTSNYSFNEEHDDNQKTE